MLVLALRNSHQLWVLDTDRHPISPQIIIIKNERKDKNVEGILRDGGKIYLYDLEYHITCDFVFSLVTWMENLPMLGDMADSVIIADRVGNNNIGETKGQAFFLRCIVNFTRGRKMVLCLKKIRILSSSLMVVVLYYIFICFGIESKESYSALLV